MSDKNSLWVERYRPKTLDNYIFHDSTQKVTIEAMIKEGIIPHLLLSGVQGSGKTTLAQIIIEMLKVDPVDLLTLNGSDENSVDVMRDKIKGFISTWAVGEFKIVHIEEADYLTPNAQGALRVMTEMYSDNARFILTCNHSNKIIPPMKSRFQEFKFVRHDINEVTEMVANILVMEKIKFTLELLDKYVRVAYPDIRKIIQILQQFSKTGVLLPLENIEGSGEYKLQMLHLIEKDDWQGARALACSNVTQDGWEDVYRFLYESLEKAPKFKKIANWEAGIYAIADHLYKNTLVADPEINAAALFIKLGQIGK